MFKCYECGETFNEPSSYEEHHPYGMGYASENIACCPCCHGDFGEAEKCSICGEYFLEEEMHGNICNDCLQSQNRNYEALEKISEDDLDDVKIPRLISSVLSAEEIKTVLYRYIEEYDIDCSQYIKDDIDWFSDKLEEVIK